MKIRYRKQATQDLKKHYDYLKLRNPKAASRFLVQIENAEFQLLDMPFSGQKLDSSDIRFKQITDFKIKVFYRLYNNDIIILRLYHFARLNPYQS